MTIKVDKGLPLPIGREHQSKKELKYPWKRMEVGDSFFIPLENGDTIERLQQRISISGRRFGTKFSTHQVHEGGKLGVRTWRIA